MDNILKLFISNTSTTMSGKLDSVTYKEFKKRLGYFDDSSMFRANSFEWDGYISTVCYNKTWCKCSLKKDGMHFPTGLISIACNFFKEFNIPYEIIDERPIYPIHELKTSICDGVNLFPYQKEVIDKAINSQRGIIKMATGAGKTIVSCGIISELGTYPTIFYVTSKDLLEQAYDEITRFVWLNGSPQKIGRVGGGYKDIQNITVMTVQTAIRSLDGKYIKFDEEDNDDKTDISDIKTDIKELIQSAKLIIIDECQHARAETIQIISDNSVSARWRYGNSATPYRDHGDDILIDACFGKQIVNITASWLIKNSYLVKPYIAFVPIKNLTGKNFGTYQSTYKEGIVENQYRNELIGKIAKSLTEQGRTTLILVQHIPHGELIQEQIPGSIFIHGSSSKKNRKNHISNMKSGIVPVTISSSIFDEGIDVRPLDALILAGGGKSPTRALQRIGRVIRSYTYPNGRIKTDAYIYDLWDHLKYLGKHAQDRRRIYRTEEEFDIREFDID